jgi:hypothetical protein
MVGFRRSAQCVVALAVAIAVLFAATTGPSGASINRSVSGRNDMREHKRPRRAHCTSGRVFLGARAGAINFSADCSGPAKGVVVGVVLGRSSRRDPSGKSGIITFSHKPSLTGTGARERHGVCLVIRGGLGCHAGAYGRVRILGRIWVRKGQQCAKRVELKTPKPPICNSRGVCFAVERMRILASGQPRGC